MSSIWSLTLGRKMGLGDRPAGLGKLLSSPQTLGTQASQPVHPLQQDLQSETFPGKVVVHCRERRSDSDGLMVTVGLQQNLSTKRVKRLQKSAIPDGQGGYLACTPMYAPE